MSMDKSVKAPVNKFMEVSMAQIGQRSMDSDERFMEVLIA
jgi:hypothetical protein